MEVAQALDNSGSTKRRKVSNGELRLSSSKPVRISGCDSEGVTNTSKNLSDSVENEDLTAAEMSFISGDIPASCCSIDASIMQKPKYADLDESAETETTVRGDLSRRERLPLKQIKTHTLSPNLMAGNFSTPMSEFKEESEKQPVLIDSRRTIPPEKTPPAAELEEFFAAAEKDIQNRFENKYNYDIVNDVPLKGRFEWIQLKP